MGLLQAVWRSHLLSGVQARVTIVDTTESGVVQFPNTHISVKCTKDKVHVPVIRKGGCNGAVTVTYATQTDTAAAGVDSHCIPICCPCRQIQCVYMRLVYG